MAKSLLDLFLKDLSFKWKEDKHKAFEDLKEKLLFAPTLKFPNFTKLFKVHTNAK
jgi:two-component SAPR family response regulator